MNSSDGPTTNSRLTAEYDRSAAPGGVGDQRRGAQRHQYLGETMANAREREARPRMRMNQREIVTFTTMFPMSVSPRT